MEYQLRRSNRRSIAIEVTRDGEVIVRAPQWMLPQEIETVVDKHRKWIGQKLAWQADRREAFPEPDAAQEALLRQKAADLLPALVEHWSHRMGVEPTGLRITSARTRHGSCSAKNRLCFSWRLMQYPPGAVEAVVVHELAHIRHKNHSAAFYAEVEKYLPDYQQRIRLLRQTVREEEQL